MRKLLFLIVLLSQTLTVFANHKRSDSLLLVLDKTIQDKFLYAEKRERQIDSLSNLLNIAANLEHRYHLNQRLYELYRHYNMNSALSFSENQAMIATAIQSQQLLISAKMNTSEILGIMGMYKESLDIVTKIDREQLDQQQWPTYYHIHHSLYLLMSENALAPREKKQYEQLISHYKDSILLNIEVNSLGYQ